MGTVAIGIGIGIGIGLGSVETVLHIFIEANFIGIRIGVSVGIGVGQWKHNIIPETNVTLNDRKYGNIAINASNVQMYNWQF